ncbi:ATP-binding protein [Marichromatium gracile]|uniref:histidine kinase n=1 Tax=Marichromatium gracile TaxID=1048 RepID=A0ABR5VGZ3_MARGR|nr:ATP-binding protein [Marichromatium gracile]KXX63662.1 hybrid sensor histidine kinase/response regulator [Marichromatium gracile]
MRHWLERLSIRYKLMLLMLVVAIAVLLLSGASHGLNQRQVLQRSAIDELNALGDMLAYNVAAALTFDDPEAAARTLGALADRPQLLGAYVYDLDGGLFARYPPSAEPLPPNEYGPDGKGHPGIGIEPDHLHVVRAIVIDDEVIGHVHLLDTPARVRAALNRSLAISTLTLIMAVVAALLLAHWLQRLVSAPILSLTRAMERVSSARDYGVRVNESRGDELGSLVHGFNDMLDQIQQRDLRLESYREDLERQVHARTRELERTVAALAEARDRAEAASRAKSDFLATMSHEIRTPMNAVLGMAELLRKSGLNARQIRFAETIQRSGEALLEIINDILDFSKIEAGRLSLERYDFELRALIEGTVQLFAESASIQGLRLETELPEDLPARVNGDGARLRQILMNLIGNAVKFTAAGEVRVRALTRQRAHGGLILVVAVSDTGPGIDPTQQEDIFEAFAQGDGSITRDYGGTGLGLAICRQLARMMEGDIRVDSAPGRGATFTLEARFDEACGRVHPGTLETGQIEHETDPDSTLRGRVLLVEDNPVNQEMATLMLEDLGLEVVIADNGEEAVKAFAHDAFDLVLMDCHMPVMDGFSATAAIRRLEGEQGPASPVPIIALTANVQKGIEQRCDEAGMNGYLSKPFSQRQLAARIAPWVVARSPVVGGGGGGGAPALLDPAVLDSIRALRRDGRPDPLVKVIGLYLDSAPKLMSELRQGLADDAAEVVQLAAHTLKSSSANLGAHGFAATCRVLERLARAGELDEAGGTLAAAETQFQELVAALERLQRDS